MSIGRCLHGLKKEIVVCKMPGKRPEKPTSHFFNDIIEWEWVTQDVDSGEVMLE